jgi:hypothetical protein
MGHNNFQYYYHHHYGPICMLGSTTTSTDCRYYSTNGYSSGTCTPYGWPTAWSAVG